MNILPPPGKDTIWKHKNGDKYHVLIVSNLDSERLDEYPPTVTYQRLRDGTIWSRPLSKWHDSFTSLF